MAGTAGRSGRRPMPTARKALAGNPGKRALNKDEPVFTPIKGVEPPEWFAEEDLPLATIMWQLTTKELCGQGLLCVTDLAVLERWCVAYEFWRRAVKNIARQGNTITGAMGGMVKNPELTAKKEQESEMSSTGAMLGLDPSSRQIITNQPPAQFRHCHNVTVIKTEIPTHNRQHPAGTVIRCH
ncbi:phage terminase small subunit P27 family [Escherichia coli]|uniref:phage terminase small subunit P27 family n=1 Tax=Escherichia coli TaxID=562 RepID=UPI003EDEF07F